MTPQGVMNIGILEGSLREKSLSRTVARTVQDFAPDGVVCTLLPNPGTLPHFNQDLLDVELPRQAAELRDAIFEVDALLIVTPEYNWSIPGTLKNAIDWLSRLSPNPLEHKPAAVWTVSPGQLGGARAHEPIRHVLHSQNMRVMAKPEVQVAMARQKIDLDAATISDAGTRAFLAAHLVAFRAFAGL